MAWEWLSAFGMAFGLIFVAELGDKTQLIILSLASKGYSSKKLALGAVCGFAVIVFVGGILALLLAQFIDLIWSSLISGIVFGIIGLFQIFLLIRNRDPEECCDDEKVMERTFSNAFAAGFIAIFTMELGDKTQLMTILLAASSSSIVGTLIGSWVALSLLAIIGAFAGEWLQKRVPKRKIDWTAAILFLMIGLLMIVSSLPNVIG
jgi:putative Ca2+/H+ antiporter (TMEM165/GDT1 family)